MDVNAAVQFNVLGGGQHTAPHTHAGADLKTLHLHSRQSLPLQNMWTELSLEGSASTVMGGDMGIWAARTGTCPTHLTFLYRPVYANNIPQKSSNLLIAPSVAPLKLSTRWSRYTQGPLTGNVLLFFTNIIGPVC